MRSSPAARPGSQRWIIGPGGRAARLRVETASAPSSSSKSSRSTHHMNPGRQSTPKRVPALVHGISGQRIVVSGQEDHRASASRSSRNAVANPRHQSSSGCAVNRRCLRRRSSRARVLLRQPQNRVDAPKPRARSFRAASGSSCRERAQVQIGGVKDGQHGVPGLSRQSRTRPRECDALRVCGSDVHAARLRHN